MNARVQNELVGFLSYAIWTVFGTFLQAIKLSNRAYQQEILITLQYTIYSHTCHQSKQKQDRLSVC